LQLEIGFAAAGEPDDRDRERTGTAGVFTGRFWVESAHPDQRVVSEMKNGLELARPVSDRLLTLLAARGLTEASELDRFFFPSDSHLHDPMLLDEMDAAVRRLLAAAAGGESVAIHGDFDVDGMTGAALLDEICTGLKVDGSSPVLVETFVPDRADGYGVAVRKLEEWAAAGVDLLITVDTGSAAAQEIARACELGMDVVVLDHHLFGERPAGATALVNPCREGNRYPNPDLCGVGVAFKLAQALSLVEPGCLPADFCSSVVELAALGLIADQMSLTGENRTLVLKGLQRMNEFSRLRPGLAALFSVSGLDRGFPLTASSLAYQVAPRLNACGRVGDVRTALELLTTRDPARARDLAHAADITNERRKEADLRVKEDAAAKAAPFIDRGDRGLVLSSADWHRGVIGISAARLVEMFNVPAILFAEEGREARGSARSVPGVDLKQALDRCAGLLIRHGGHAQAAGATLLTSDLDAFRDAFLDALAFGGEAARVDEVYDMNLPLSGMSLDDVSRLTLEVSQMEPFGEGNRTPLFRCDGLRLSRLPAVMGAGGQHLRFSFAGPSRAACAGPPALAREFICFGAGDAWRGLAAGCEGGNRDLLDRRWDILFRVSPNTWRPRSGAAVDPVQQQLIDIKPSEEP